MPSDRLKCTRDLFFKDTLAGTGWKVVEAASVTATVFPAGALYPKALSSNRSRVPKVS